MHELGKIESENILNKLFFSTQNKKIIQNAIRYQVYSKSHYKIGEQCNRELLIIMRSIYLQYSKHQDDNVQGEIKNLNNKVVNYCIPGILTNIKQYIQYKKDFEKMPTPMELPKNMSNKGSKSLEIFNIN